MKKNSFIQSLSVLLFFSVCVLTVFAGGLVTGIITEDGYAKEVFFGKVYRVKDGDSLLLIKGKKSREIRLYGIDAPEYGQPGGRDAYLWLKKNVAGKGVHVRVIDHDRYGRMVAIVSREGKVINEELVERGLARVYPKYCRRKICEQWKKKELEAIREKRGLWRRQAAVAPWEWRHKHGKKR